MSTPTPPERGTGPGGRAVVAAAVGGLLGGAIGLGLGSLTVAGVLVVVLGVGAVVAGRVLFTTFDDDEH